jgi:hypothetical protein
MNVKVIVGVCVLGVVAYGIHRYNKKQKEQEYFEQINNFNQMCDETVQQMNERVEETRQKYRQEFDERLNALNEVCYGPNPYMPKSKPIEHHRWF